ncbi:MAG: flagellar biosynthetic protein FliQ [Myxococcota bacterium]|nr:flagellar type III secretion system protein FliQ [Myxococcales bacterium]
MSVEHVGLLLQDTVQTTLWVSSPILVAAVVVGLVISILQAATQVNEQTLTFVPKIVIVLALFTVLFPWIMQNVIELSLRIFAEIAAVGGGPA